MADYKVNVCDFSKLQIAISEWIESQPELSALREDKHGNTGVPVGPGSQLTVSCVALQATKAALAVIALAADVAEMAKAD